MKLLLILVVLVIVLGVRVAMQSSEFRVTRSAVMNASASVIFEQVNDLHRWNAWSPWAKMDPNATNSFDGPPDGPGARMRWSGNRQVGQGSMTLTESRPNEFVRFKLEFLKPFVATHSAEFTFQPQGAQTLVTWTMSGHNNVMGKVIGLVINCDKMVGGQFEKGLASLKSIVGG